METKYSRPGEGRMGILRRHVVTSWSISAFWVLLSVLLAILATYSFLQADWVIKRNLVITKYYEATPNLTESKSHFRSKYAHYNSYYSSSIGHVDGNRSSFPVAATPDLDNYSDPSESNVYEVEESAEVYRKIIKVSKIITTTRFGTLGVCTSHLSNGIFQCHLYEQEHGRHPISSLWPMVTMVGGSGCVMLCVSAVLSLLAVSLPSSQLRHRVATTIGHAQTVAVVLLFISLLVFPLGFNSDFVRHHCGPAVGPYDIGDCEVGWAYALVLVCASLALYCPVLVKFTADVRYDSLPKYL